MKPFNSQVIDDIARRLGEGLPPGLQQMQNELEKNVRASLASVLAKMDLVTREEFDVQREVLARTRAKIDALETRVAQLEAQWLDRKASSRDTD